MFDDWGLFNPPDVQLPDNVKDADDDFNPDWMQGFFDEDDEE